MSLTGFFKELWAKARKNAPGLLTAAGIGLMSTGTVLAVRATPRALEAIEEMKEEEGHEHLTVVQTIQATWKYYILALAAEVGGAGCLIGACREGYKRQAALAITAEAAQTGIREFNEYRKFVAEKLGEKKEAEIHAQAVQQMVNQNPPPANMDRQFIDGEAPKPVCHDISYGRYYYVDYDTVLAAVNRLNTRINNTLEGYVSLNDFYDEIHVERIDAGNMVGWSQETGNIEIPNKEDLDYAGTPNGWPCWVLKFTNPPQYEYKFFRKH